MNLLIGLNFSPTLIKVNLIPALLGTYMYNRLVWGVSILLTVLLVFWFMYDAGLHVHVHVHIHACNGCMCKPASDYIQ